MTARHRDEELGHVARGQPVGRLAIRAASLAAEQPRPQPKRDEEQLPAALGDPRPAVLREEAQVAAEVLPIQAPAVGGAADVHTLGSREEEHLPAGLPEAVAPVGLLAEEEVVLVEKPDLVDRAPADEQARAHDELGLAHLVVVEPTRVEPVQHGRAGRELAQEEVLGRQPPERGEAAHRALEAPVLVQEPRSDDRGLGPPVGERHEPPERVADEPRVRVHEQDVAAGRPADPLVPARGEPAVLALDELDVGEALPHELDRPVGRAVVHDHDAPAREALEAGLDPGQRVVRHHDDGDVGGLRASHAPPARSIHGAGRRARARHPPAGP